MTARFEVRGAGFVVASRFVDGSSFEAARNVKTARP